ncbi:MAG: PQQ-binding-like beta-propeller repeat protein [Phycisphaeraceae bacterium]|nr:PQQ-binding-like beta-propeller repeat protein [Phycisphaeraceae bacterium]
MTNMAKIGIAGLILGVGIGFLLMQAVPDAGTVVEPPGELPSEPVAGSANDVPQVTVPPTMPSAETDVSQAVAPPQPGQDWPMYRGSQGLLGVTRETLPETLDLLWSFKTEGPVRSSAVVQGGRVYIGSADKHLYALDLDTGEKIWAFEADSPIEAPPMVLGDTVYVGDLGGFVYAVDANSGEKRWVHETDGEVAGAVNWAQLGERLCVLAGSHDAYVHCLDAGTGEPIWRFETDSYVNGTVAVSGDLCAFGGCDAFVYVVRTADANEVTRIDAGAYVASSTVLAEGRVYAGNYDGLFIGASIQDPNQRWEHAIDGGEIFSSAAVGSDRVVVGDRDSQVLCLDRHTGDLEWTFKTLDAVDSSPVIAGDKVVVGSDDGRLYLLSLETGKKLWSYELGEPIISSPAVARGRVIIGCDDGSVYAFGTKTEK